MKRLTLSIAVFLGMVAFSFSQHHRGGGTIEDRVDRRLDKMDEVVKFTGTQRNDLKILLTDLAKKKKDAFCTNEIGSAGMKNAMKDIQKEKKAGVKKILSNDQVKLLKTHLKEKKAEHKGKKQDHKKGGSLDERIDHRLDQIDEIVKFTGNQRNDMKVLLTDLATRKKAAFCANDLGTDGMKNAMKVINEDKKEGVKKILSEDQIKLIKEYRKNKKGERKKKGGDKGFDDDLQEK